MMTPIAITVGEPAGIGPDLVVMMAKHTFSIPLVVIGNAHLLKARAKLLGIPLTITPFTQARDYPSLNKNTLCVLDVPLLAEAFPNKLDSRNAPYVMDCLKIAATKCLSGEVSAIVTAPVHKAIINQANIPFTGHTEFFAEQTKTPHVVMMLATKSLRVALATTHLPLRDVASAITPESLTRTIQILHRELQSRFAIDQPNIIVAGLNPHAGENGYLGDEEIKVISPVIAQLQQQGINVTGPISADSLFTPQYLHQADVILAMYHDQGLPVLKHVGFGHAVNITLGLPIIRTSVDHGTALPLAGTGKADPASLYAAIEMAAQMVG